MNKLRKLYKKFLYRYKDSVNNKDIYILNCIDTKLYKETNVEAKKLVIISCLFPNIGIYLENIIKINYYLDNGKVIDSTWCNYKFENKNLYSFITNKKGEYVDEEDIINIYKDNTEKILNKISIIKKSNEDKDIRNFYLLNRFIENINYINKTLVEVTLNY